jgi:transaldolase
MQIWLETTDLPSIEKAQKIGILHGVTTTPAMLAANPRETLASLLSAQPGPVAVEVSGDMVSQGKALYEYSPRIIVKVPVSEQGYEAIHLLSKQIPIMACAITQPTQALIAALAGAQIVAPYFSRLMKPGDNPLAQLEAIKKMILAYRIKTSVLAVTPKTLEQIKSCAEIGIDAVTMREDVFRDFIETHELTAHAIAQYDDDWKKIESLSWF